jgi:hypothetical protein
MVAALAGEAGLRFETSTGTHASRGDLWTLPPTAGIVEWTRPRADRLAHCALRLAPLARAAEHAMKNTRARYMGRQQVLH